MTTQTDRSSEERTGTSSGRSGSFTKLRSLGPPGQRAAEELDQACDLLRKEGVEQGAARLKRIDEYADQVDFPTLERLIDPERTVEEFAAKRSQRVHQLHSWRNSLVLVPLLITWLALSWASIDYSGELAHHPGLVTKPFLLLWQHHFGGRFIPTFAWCGIADLAILILVLGFTIWVHGEENRLMKQQTQIADLVDVAMGELAVAISSSLANRSSANPEEWAKEVGRVIDVAMKQTETLAETGRKTIEQASRELATVYTAEREFIDTFSTAVSEALSHARDEYEQFMNRIATEVTKAIQQQMNPLLGKFDGLVSEFGKHHETYRTGVTELTQGISTMSDSAEALATSARDHAKVGEDIGANLAKVAESQRDFADQVTKNVTSMDGSAKAMETTAEVLRGEVMSGLKDLTGNVVAASRDLESVQGNLKATTSAFSTTTTALGASATALSTSTTALGATTRELRAAADALRSSAHGGRPFWRRGPRRSAAT